MQKNVSRTKPILMLLSVVIIMGLSFSVMSLNVTDTPLTKTQHTSIMQFRTWTQYTAMPYDQGIYRIYVQMNDTGSWVDYVGADPLEYNDALVLSANYSYSTKITVRHTLNKTLLGFTGASDGRLLYRLKVTVTNQTGTTIFTQQNGTNTDWDVLSGAIYYNDCEFTLNFLHQYDQLYNITLDYDTFW